MELVCKIGVRVVFIFMMVRCYPEAPQRIEKPSASLSPKEVVLAQVKALQNNDIPHKNAGVHLVYEFSSPYHKAENGPLQQYESKFAEHKLQKLINCNEYLIEEHFVNDKKAEFFVFVLGTDNREQVFLFRLSRQSIAPYSGFWMTDDISVFKDTRALTGEYFLV